MDWVSIWNILGIFIVLFFPVKLTHMPSKVGYNKQLETPQTIKEKLWHALKTFFHSLKHNTWLSWLVFAECGGAEATGLFLSVCFCMCGSLCIHVLCVNVCTRLLAWAGCHGYLAILWLSLPRSPWSLCSLQYPSIPKVFPRHVPHQNHAQTYPLFFFFPQSQFSPPLPHPSIARFPPHIYNSLSFPFA